MTKEKGEIGGERNDSRDLAQMIMGMVVPFLRRGKHWKNALLGPLSEWPRDLIEQPQRYECLLSIFGACCIMV